MKTRSATPTDVRRALFGALLLAILGTIAFFAVTTARKVDAAFAHTPADVSRQGASKSGARFDEAGRLIDYPGKTQIACPRQTPRTAVIFVGGQSNAANYASEFTASKIGPAVVNVFGDRCFVAQSPLLGSSGEWGEPWTALGNALVRSGAYDTVLFVPTAIGGTAAASWTREGPLHRILADSVSASNAYSITHVIWFQGETDVHVGTTGAAYRSQLLDVFAGLREVGVRAPIYVAVASRCERNTPHWNAANAIALSQKSLRNFDPSIRLGVDADAILAGADRYDDCHLSGSGVRKLAAAWLGVLRDRHAKRE